MCIRDSGAGSWVLAGGAGGLGLSEERDLDPGQRGQGSERPHGASQCPVGKSAHPPPAGRVAGAASLRAAALQ
eukprot:10087437-Alexandrium_andersonii.AAC.1